MDIAPFESGGWGSSIKSLKLSLEDSDGNPIDVDSASFILLKITHF